MARIVNITTYRNGKYKDEDYGKKYEFDELLRIGRGELADVKIGSHFVSECHCFIINYKEKFAKVGKSQDLQTPLTRNLKIPVAETNYLNFSKEKYYLGDCSTCGTWHPISRGKNFVVEEKSKKLESIVGAGNLGEIIGIIGADLNELMRNVEGEGRIIRSLENYPNFSKRTLKERNLAFIEAANFAKGFIQSSLIREVRKALFQRLWDNSVREKLVEGGKVKLLNEGDVIGIYSVWELQFFEK